MHNKMEEYSKTITVQQWLDFFNKCPDCAQILSDYAKRLFLDYIDDELPEKVKISLAKASVFCGISSNVESAKIDCFLVGDEDERDLDKCCLYSAIHQYQLAQLGLTSEEYKKIDALFACVDKPDKLNSIISNFIDTWDYDAFGAEQDSRFIKGIKDYIKANYESVSYPELLEGTKKEISNNISNASPSKQGDYKSKYDKVFSDAFFDKLKKLTTLRALARYCGYVSDETVSTFHSDLEAIYYQEDEQSTGFPSRTDIKKIIWSLDPKELEETPDEIREYVELMRSDGNVILQGAPGVGKTFVAQKIMEYFRSGDDSRVAFVTFHQSLDYEDFVEGIHAKTVNGQISYEREDGIFKRMALEAAKRPSEEFLLVIDEINRGNVSKIFGELISLIEFDKRELGKYPLHATLPYSRESFVVPSNLYLLGTMNTTDRSVGSIDYALRRRFSFRTIKANREVIESAQAQDLFDAVEKFIDSFKTPELLNPSDIMVGHGYFKDDIDKSWEFKIKPLLEEYINDGLLRKEAYEQLVETGAQGFMEEMNEMTDD